jgi:putative membrane protein
MQQLACLTAIAVFVSVNVFAQTPTKAQRNQTTVTQIQASQESKQNPGQNKAISMDEAQTLAVAKLIHDFDKKSGELGHKKGKEAIVTTYADQLISDHKGLERTLENFEKKTGIQPKDNQISADLEKKWQERLKKLEDMKKGSDFDKAFIDHEIKFHQEALNIIDSSLLKNAKNSELKEILAKTDTAMKTNLQRAQYAQQTFGNEGIRY